MRRLGGLRVAFAGMSSATRRRTSRPRRSIHPGYRHPDFRNATKRIKAAVAEGAPMICDIAGPDCRKAATLADHIVPLLEGGSPELPNLRPACKPCNDWRARVSAKRRRNLRI